MPTTGITDKQYISAISFFDQREIERSVIDIQNEADYLDIMSLMGRYEPTNLATYHNFVNEATWVLGDTTGAVVSGSGTPTVTTTLTAATSRFANIGTAVLFPNGKEGIIRTVTPVGAQDTIVIDSTDNTNLTHTAGQKLSFFSNAQYEQSSPPESQRYTWTKYLNKIQTFRIADEITDIQKASPVEVNFNGQPYLLVVQHAIKFQRLRGEIAAQMIAGTMSADSFSDASPIFADANGHARQTTRGLDNYITTYGINDTIATLGTYVLADLKDLIAAMIANKTDNDYMVWHGTVAGTVIDDYFKATGSSGVQSARLMVNGRTIDLEVDSWRYGGFKFQKMRLPILDHPQLFNYTGGTDISKNLYFIPTGNAPTQMGKASTPRIRMRYIPQPMEGGTGDSIYKQTDQGLLAPVPVGREAKWTTDWITYQGLEVLGAQHFAKQKVLS
jgi:hypothetical protein